MIQCVLEDFCLDLILGPETQLKIKMDFNVSNNFMSRNENTDRFWIGAKSHGLCENGTSSRQEKMGHE